jgi:TRAP-type mannitol/chloroaromatic compound transport system permease small subunit
LTNNHTVGSRGALNREDDVPKPLIAYVRYVDAVNRVIGRATMFMIFVMMGVLLWSSVSKTFFLPSLWTLEMAQFLMVAYFLLGGAYSLQLGDHVRMDLLYGSWSNRTKALMDAVTVLFLIFYLIMLFYGALSSTSYAIEYGERSYSAWRPYMAPIKIIMSIGIFMMLLQAIATLIKDVAALRGIDLGSEHLDSESHA